MATTLYLRSANAAGVIPNAQQAVGKPGFDFYESDGAGAMTPLKMLTAPGTAKTTIGGANRAETKTTTYAHWMKCWVSNPLDVNQSIDTGGTFTCVLNQYEGQAQHNTYPRIYIYVWKADDSGIRGVLFAEAASATECGTVVTTNTTFWSGTDIANTVAALAGDRIVIEVMSYCNQPSTTGDKQVTIGYDAAAGAAGCSTLTFSQNITFQGESYSQTCTAEIRVAEHNDTANVRRLKKIIGMTFKNATAGASRGRESLTFAVDNAPPLYRLRKLFKKAPIQGITVGDRLKKSLARVMSQAAEFTKAPDWAWTIVNTVTGAGGLKTIELSQALLVYAVRQPLLKVRQELKIAGEVVTGGMGVPILGLALKVKDNVKMTIAIVLLSASSIPLVSIIAWLYRKLRE